MVHPSIHSHCLLLLFSNLLFSLIFSFIPAFLALHVFLFGFFPSENSCEYLNSLKMCCSCCSLSSHSILFKCVAVHFENVWLQPIFLHSEWQHQVGLNEQMQGHHRHKPHRQQPSAEHPVTAQHLHQPAQTPLKQHPLWVTLYVYPFTRNKEKRSTRDL